MTTSEAQRGPGAQSPFAKVTQWAELWLAIVVFFIRMNKRRLQTEMEAAEVLREEVGGADDQLCVPVLVTQGWAGRKGGEGRAHHGRGRPP